MLNYISTGQGWIQDFSYVRTSQLYDVARDVISDVVCDKA